MSSDPHKLKRTVTLSQLIAETKTKRGPPLSPEIVERLNRKCRQFVETGNIDFEPDLNDQMLRTWCEFYLVDPDDGHGFGYHTGFVRLLMRRFVARVPKSKKMVSAQEIAWQIDLQILEMRKSMGDARRHVANLNKISEAAATVAHKRYGRRKSPQELWSNRPKPRGTNGR